MGWVTNCSFVSNQNVFHCVLKSCFWHYSSLFITDYNGNLRWVTLFKSKSKLAQDFSMILMSKENNFLPFLVPVYLCGWLLVFKNQIKSYCSYRPRVVPSSRERWTDWHRILAHTMTSSRSPYPTVTKMEISTPNRSVLSSFRSVWNADQTAIWPCRLVNCESQSWSRYQ